MSKCYYTNNTMGSNGHATIFFDVRAKANPVTIHAFEVGFRNTTSSSLQIFTHGGTFSGTEQNASAWQNVLSQSGIYPPGKNMLFTRFYLSRPVTIQPYNAQAFCIHSSVGVTYTNVGSIGAQYAGNNDLSLHAGHYATNYQNAFTGCNYQPRGWTGKIYYDAGVPEKCYYTNNSMGTNGHATIFFDVRAKAKPVTVTAFEVGFRNTTSCNLQIYTHTGTHSGSEQNAYAWQTVFNQGGIYPPSKNTLFRKFQLTTPVTIPAYGAQAFCIHSNVGVTYTNAGSIGQEYASNTDLSLNAGHYSTNYQNAFTGCNYQPRGWTGKIYYRN